MEVGTGSIRSDHAAESRAASQARHTRAQQIAARIVAAHGNTITVEDLPVPFGRGWPRAGGLSQPAPATDNTRCRIDRDRQPPPGEPGRRGTSRKRQPPKLLGAA